MGAAGIGFIYTKTDAAKFDPVPMQRELADINSKNAVQDNDIQTLKADVREIKTDVKEILKTLRPNDYKSAKVENTLLIGGVDSKTGEPKNETE